MFFVYYIVALTPLKSYVIPDFPKIDERKNIIENALKIDSLEYKIKIYEEYTQKVQAMLKGEDVAGYNLYGKDSTKTLNNIDVSVSKDDSIMRKQVEDVEEFSLSNTDSKINNDRLSGLILFPPVKGLVTSPFNLAQNHFGTDVATTKDNVIHAVQNGTVILAQWTLETGFVIQIQHDNDLISIYKHCSKLLKTTGDKVLSGDAVGIVGNTGEITTGPHLHLELWHKGTPINPEQFIVFQ